MASYLLYRADIKQYIGLPSPSAIYEIYHTCLKELTRVSRYLDLLSPGYHRLRGNQVGIISSTHQLLDLRTLEVLRFLENETTRLSLHLKEIAKWVWSVGVATMMTCIHTPPVGTAKDSVEELCASFHSWLMQFWPPR